MKKTVSFAALLFSLSTGLFAQMGGGAAAPMSALNSGDIKALDNVKVVNIIYSYSDLSVGAFRKEADYIAKKCEDLEKKDPGTCDKFKTSWNDARKGKYEPKFEELFNKYGEKEIEMSGRNYTNNEAVTLDIHTVFVEPGVNIGIYKKPSFIDVECTFKDKTGKSLCVIYIKNAVGSQMMGYDYDVSSRLVESYAKAAKMLALLVKKERKKASK